ncbi:MAG: GNAT family protein [Pseudomonadota bacterium]
MTLRPLQDSDYPVLEDWVQIPDVCQQLEYEAPPNRHELKVAVLGRQFELLMIQGDAQPVGFFLVYFRGLVAHRSREFDIAVPAKVQRQQGLAQAAIRALEHWAFDEQGLVGVWAKIFADNHPCLELVRACGWPRSATVERAYPVGDALRDVVFTWMTPEIRATLKQRRGF